MPSWRAWTRSCSAEIGLRCPGLVVHRRARQPLQPHRPRRMDWRLRGLHVKEVREHCSMGDNQQGLTEVLCAFCYHSAIDFQESVSSIDDLEGIGDDLIFVVGCDILSSAGSSASSLSSSSGAYRSVGVKRREQSKHSLLCR